MKKKSLQLLEAPYFLKDIEILNSYYKIKPRNKSKLSLTKHKYFVKMIKRLKVLGILPFINLNYVI